MSTITVRLNSDEAKLYKEYAEFKNIPLSTLMKEALEEKIENEGLNINIATELGMHPFAFGKLKSASTNYTTYKLEKLILDFDEYDSDSKTGKIDAQIGLKRIILNM